MYCTIQISLFRIYQILIYMMNRLSFSDLSEISCVKVIESSYISEGYLSKSERNKSTVVLTHSPKAHLTFRHSESTS